jgi:hypothetical protein
MHIKVKCKEGRVQKRRGIVRVLDIEPAQEQQTSANDQPLHSLPEHVLEDQNGLRLRVAMRGRVPLENIDERVTFFMYTEEGRRAMLDIYNRESLVDQFLIFIKYYAGNGAPLSCRSIARYGRKGKSVITMRDLGPTMQSLRRCSVVTLLIEMYGYFHNMCAQQATFRADVPKALADGAHALGRKLERPIERGEYRRAIPLKEILDTRRGDDDVMNVLVDQFPSTLSYVDVPLHTPS